MRISDWSSDVCSSDLLHGFDKLLQAHACRFGHDRVTHLVLEPGIGVNDVPARHVYRLSRSEEHTSELQSLMRISYAVFCLKKNKTQTMNNSYYNPNHQIRSLTAHTILNHI